MAVATLPSAQESAGLLKAPEAARYLAIGLTSLYQLVQAGRLPHVKLGRSTRYRRADLDRLIAESTVGH